MNESRAVLDRSISERDFQAQIVELARALGWRVYHTRDSQGSAPGFPDLIMIRGATLLAMEVKSAKGKEAPAQQEWIAAFKQVRYVVADFIYPKHWDQVEDTLRRTLR